MTKWLINFSVQFPKTTLALALGVTVLFGWQFPKVRIDTDPKNMLPDTSAVRVYNDEVERQFSLHPDTIVVGVVNERGLLNPESLRRVAEITDRILALPGVITRDVLGLRTVDDVSVNGAELGVRPLLADVPANDAEVAALRKALFANPLMVGRFISTDATTTAVYVPIEATANGKEIADRIREILAAYQGPERFYVAGDPVARDTFGAQMFRQMGVFSPIAGMVMCVVLWLMFRSVTLIAANMGVAMLSIVWAMGALIGGGYTVHIMSSMIPVFLMAISTDTVHIFNEFCFRFAESRDKRTAVVETMQVVGPPVVLSDLTTAAAFVSLATGPIVPVKVFGIFVGVGTLAILLMSFTVVPALLMLMSERRVLALAAAHTGKTGSGDSASGWLLALGRLGVGRSRAVLLVGLGLLVLAAAGMSQIRINNNLVSWFRAGSEIREADRVMNEKLGGTSTGYLVVRGGEPDFVKRPETLRWIEALQRDLESDPLVGKTVSVADVVKRINRVLHGDQAQFDTIPDSAEIVAQQLFVFTMAVKPRDLDSLVDYPFQAANIMLQFKSWDADVMRRAIARAEAFARAHPLPGLPAATAAQAGAPIKPAGIANFNLVWNDEVLWGMLSGFISSLVLVLVLLVFEYRSLRWGVVSFVPLLFTVALIYGAVGLVGKDFDMPISVLSTLSLGMAIDFAIHFVSRFRARMAEAGTFRRVGDAPPELVADALLWTAGRPGRGIMRNAVLFAAGFFVMLFASLTPYITVGAFMAAIMILSSLATLLFLPALVTVFGRWLPQGPRRSAEQPLQN
ncbi:MAG: MMPL family transporter [Verrucomicrobia bacterium]|nr:MMPL family transporter [Verrucomicrobiota bacterium]